MDEEKMIKNSPDPITISGTKTILEQMINCVCKIKINSVNGTGFFCRIPFEQNMMNFFMTNYHILNEISYNENKSINLFLNDDQELKVIDLKIKRQTYFNKDYDIALIELKETDNINDYLELDDKLFKEETKAYFKDISIYALQYPYGKTASVSYGLISDIDKYEIKHTCSTEHGSSGSPILNLSNNKLIGIHKKGSKIFNYNMGTFLKFPLNDFIKKKNPSLKICLIKESIPNKSKPETNFCDDICFIVNERMQSFINILNEVKNLIDIQTKKLNVVFSHHWGFKCIITVKYGTTIGQLLKIFMIRFRQLNGTNDKIIFLYNGEMLKLDNKNTVEKYFEKVKHPCIGFFGQGRFIYSSYSDITAYKYLKFPQKIKDELHKLQREGESKIYDILSEILALSLRLKNKEDT